MWLNTLVSLLTVCVAWSVAPPTWEKSYIIKGTLQLPYAEINEPFQAYYDSTVNKSRIDYYDDLMRTYQIGATKGSYGSNKKVIYASFDKTYNKRTCYKADGDKDNPVSIQAVLPDLTGFQHIGPGIIRSIKCDIWQKVEMKGQKKNTYTMYVSKDGGKPVHYEMMGYDTLLGSHYDKYYLDYENYNPGKINSSTFEIKGLNCTGFPGPGAENKVLMNPMTEYMNNDDSHIHTMFNQFKQLHKKTYAGEKEHETRRNIFRQNVRFIHSKNRATLGYSLAVNHLADLSDNEMRMMRGRKHSHGYNGGLPFNKGQHIGALPLEVDWRLYGAVTPVKDQAVCGSCWSFGSTGALEGAYFLKTGMLVRLSQQELVDCSWKQGNNGCDGGEDFRSYQWIMTNGGLTTEEQYGPYLAVDGKCKAKNVTGVAMLKGYVNVTSGDLEALRMAIAAHGPISVGIDASHKSLRFYANGVYYEPKCKSGPDDLDHAVLAVGYGVMNGKPYWLIKNSWSTYWGNDGYVLMSQKDNNCGVATAATYVVM